MKRIEKLLQEYRIRFRDTEKIKEEGYPWEDEFLTALIPLNSGKRRPAITENRIENKNGLVYMKNENNQAIWATADLKEKPDKWVVEIDEDHPKWDRFLEWTESTDRGGWMIQRFKKYCSHEGWVSNQLDEDFKDHQYITLDQWAEFFLPKVDFSILNDTDVFYLKSKQDDYLFTGGNPITKKVKGCIVEDGCKFIDRICDKNNVMELRKANDIEKEYYYTLHPELRPIKVGDWGIFWDSNRPSTISHCISSIDRLGATMWGNRYRKTKINASYSNFYRIDLTQNVQEQIDNFLKQQSI